MMDEQRLAEIEARADAATGGLWVVVHDGTERSVATTESGRFVCHLNSNMLRYSDDAEFIAHARADVPALLAEVRRLRALLDAGFLDAVNAISDEATRAMLLSPEGRARLIREADRLMGDAP